MTPLLKTTATFIALLSYYVFAEPMTKKNSYLITQENVISAKEYNKNLNTNNLFDPNILLEQSDLLDYFSLKTVTNSNLDDKNAMISTNLNKREIKNHYGGYIQAKYPSQAMITPYLIAGITVIEMGLKKPHFSHHEETFNDFSYGIGANFKITVDLAASFEYMSYVSNKIKNNTKYDFDGFTISIVKKF